MKSTFVSQNIVYHENPKSGYHSFFYVTTGYCTLYTFDWSFTHTGTQWWKKNCNDNFLVDSLFQNFFLNDFFVVLWKMHSFPQWFSTIVMNTSSEKWLFLSSHFFYYLKYKQLSLKHTIWEWSFWSFFLRPPFFFLADKIVNDLWILIAFSFSEPIVNFFYASCYKWETNFTGSPVVSWICGELVGGFYDLIAGYVLSRFCIILLEFGFENYELKATDVSDILIFSMFIIWS